MWKTELNGDVASMKLKIVLIAACKERLWEHVPGNNWDYDN